MTKPLKNSANLQSLSSALIQDDLDPYHYLRVLPDRRIIFGGEDKKSGGKPINEKVARKKYQKLIETLYKMLPFLKTENGDDLIEYNFADILAGLTIT